MATGAQLLAAYLLFWFALTTLLWLRRGESSEGKIAVTPLVVTWRTAFTFESFARLRGSRLVGLLFDAGIVNMVLIMIAAYYVLASNLAHSLSTGQHVGVVAPIIPGVTIGLRVFLYLLPGLVIAVLLHEAFHAMAARYEGIPVRSSGLMLFLGLIPAAFVEPEEDALLRAPTRAKLRVFAAGVLANTLLFLLFSGLLLAVTSKGYYLAVSAAPGGVAEKAGLPETLLLEKIVVNGSTFSDVGSFVKYVNKLRQEHGGSLRGVALVVEFVAIDGRVYKVYKPPEAAAIGIYLYSVPRALAALGPGLALSLFLVLYYAQAINIGLAGINALPIFITDGAQFIQAAVEKRLGAETARKVATLASAATIALLLPNISL